MVDWSKITNKILSEIGQDLLKGVLSTITCRVSLWLCIPYYEVIIIREFWVGALPRSLAMGGWKWGIATSSGELLPFHLVQAWKHFNAPWEVYIMINRYELHSTGVFLSFTVHWRRSISRFGILCRFYSGSVLWSCQSSAWCSWQISVGYSRLLLPRHRHLLRRVGEACFHETTLHFTWCKYSPQKKNKRSWQARDFANAYWFQHILRLIA